MRKVANRFWHDKTGVAAVEYALLLGFVAATIAVAMSGLGTAVIGALTAACINVGGPC